MSLTADLRLFMTRHTQLFLKGGHVLRKRTPNTERKNKIEEF